MRNLQCQEAHKKRTKATPHPQSVTKHTPWTTPLDSESRSTNVCLVTPTLTARSRSLRLSTSFAVMNWNPTFITMVFTGTWDSGFLALTIIPGPAGWMRDIQQQTRYDNAKKKHPNTPPICSTTHPACSRLVTTMTVKQNIHTHRQNDRERTEGLVQKWDRNKRKTDDTKNTSFQKMNRKKNRATHQEDPRESEKNASHSSTLQQPNAHEPPT